MTEDERLVIENDPDEKRRQAALEKMLNEINEAFVRMGQRVPGERFFDKLT